MNKLAYIFLGIIGYVFSVHYQLLSVTAVQYRTEQVVSSVNKTLEKGELEDLSLSEKLQVQSTLIDLSKSAPSRADQIREKIRSSDSLRTQFADLRDEISLQGETSKKELSAAEILRKLPEFSREVQKDIEMNRADQKSLTKQLLTDQEIAITFDQKLCVDGNCSKPFEEKLQEIKLQESKKMGISLDTIISNNELLIAPIKTLEEEVKEEVKKDFDVLYNISVKKGPRKEIDALSDQIKQISQLIFMTEHKPVAARMDKNTGYYSFLEKIETLWKKIENDPDINPAEKRILELETRSVYKVIVDFLVTDLEKLFESFQEGEMPAGNDFPHDQIIKIQQASRDRIENFLESKELYGNPEFKNDLDTKYASLYTMLKEGNIDVILNNKNINHFLVREDGTLLPQYKKAINTVRLRLFGRSERMSTFNKSSLASLLWSLAYYISRITVKNDKKKGLEEVKKYVEHNFDVLIQFRNLFVSIIPPKTVEADIEDIIAMLKPALDTETALKFTSKKYILSSETETTTDWE